jgi:sortase A
MQMLSTRFLERNLRITGTVFFCIYVFCTVSASVLSRVGVWAFHAHEEQRAQAAEANSAPSMAGVDFALWSAKRIEAYKDSLAMKFGTPLAVLSIPKIGLEVPVFEGTDDLTLNRGAGRITGTAGPGQLGNMGVAAHRDGFFRKLKDVHVGDTIELAANRGNYRYTVENIEIVDPANVSVLRSQPHPTITLVTCYPFYFVGSAPQRYIVHASLIDSTMAANTGRDSSQQNIERENIQ